MKCGNFVEVSLLFRDVLSFYMVLVYTSNSSEILISSPNVFDKKIAWDHYFYIVKVTRCVSMPNETVNWLQ